MTPASGRLREYVALGEAICAAADSLAAQATGKLRAAGRELAFRERVAVGLALKINSAFRALLQDCRDHRLEAMHHLKTMAEAFIAFYVVIFDPSDETAELLMAQATHKRAVRLEQGADAEWLAVTIELRDALLDGRRHLPPLEQLAGPARTRLERLVLAGLSARLRAGSPWRPVGVHAGRRRRHQHGASQGGGWTS